MGWIFQFSLHFQQIELRWQTNTCVCYANSKHANIANSSWNQDWIPAHFVYKSHGPDWKEAAGHKLKSYENTWSSSKMLARDISGKICSDFFFSKISRKVDITSGPD